MFERYHNGSFPDKTAKTLTLATQKNDKKGDTKRVLFIFLQNSVKLGMSLKS